MKQPKTDNTLFISFCENDHRGEGTTKLRSVAVAGARGHTLLRLQPLNDESEPVWSNESLIILYGYRLKYLSCMPWADGPMWNRYELPLAYGLGLLLVLAESGRWKAHYGRKTLRQKFVAGRPITARNLGYDVSLAPLLINPAQGVLFPE